VVEENTKKLNELTQQKQKIDSELGPIRQKSEDKETQVKIKQT